MHGSDRLISMERQNGSTKSVLLLKIPRTTTEGLSCEDSKQLIQTNSTDLTSMAETPSDQQLWRSPLNLRERSTDATRYVEFRNIEFILLIQH